jgi:hypothetical protein
VCFVEEGIVAKATGLVKSSREREGEEGTVWKRVCKGDAIVARGRGWAETARTYVAGSGLKAEIDEACYD